MKHAWIAVAAGLALATIPALAAEANFERNLTVNGRVELAVSTGSGHIHLTHGSATQVHISGHVKSNWGANEDRVREIAAGPPIEQTGNIIRIGKNHENYHNISIDYDIEAPADAFLEASSGSGDIQDDGVGANAKLNTGSGSIHATGLKGGFKVETGSGDIYAEQTGEGDVRAQTGSGRIELKDIHGGLHAGTGSGDIRISGSPSADWKLDTGSEPSNSRPAQYRLRAGRFDRVRHRSLRSRDDGTGIVRSPSHYGENWRRRADCAHSDGLRGRTHSLIAPTRTGAAEPAPGMSRRFVSRLSMGFTSSLFLRRGWNLQGPRLIFLNRSRCCCSRQRSLEALGKNRCAPGAGSSKGRISPI